MSKTLLVTDDALIIREMIKDAALEAGWTIVGEACNGKEAIELHAELKPDLMTLDLVMPEYGGLYALEGILKHTPDAKIIIVSALDQPEVFNEAFQKGASDFIIKPFESKQIVGALEALHSANTVTT